MPGNLTLIWEVPKNKEEFGKYALVDLKYKLKYMFY